MGDSPMLKPLTVAALLSALVAAAGCSTAGYYLQAIGGQMELVRKSRPLAQVIADPTTPKLLHDKLRASRANTRVRQP